MVLYNMLIFKQYFRKYLLNHLSISINYIIFSVLPMSVYIFVLAYLLIVFWILVFS